jgi:hemolysin activation/secretion protein
MVAAETVVAKESPAVTPGSAAPTDADAGRARATDDGSKPRGGDETKASGARGANGGKPDDKAAGRKPAEAPQRFDIFEYRVEGADLLPQIEVEESVYPFLGPSRTADDVEKARGALEKAYTAKGYQTVTVSVPQQNPDKGFVILKVTEHKVGRLRVKNSRYFDVDRIKTSAPSLAEGKVPNFNAVTKDIVGLNQWPDRKVTPALRAGLTPGTVDVDLTVEDKIPFHASVELNNRQSPSTTPLRIVATTHYDNLWQRGDTANFSYQVAPQRRSDAEVFSGSYLARTDLDWMNLLVYGVSSQSDVATVGGQNVIGPGQIIGGRVVLTLPGRDGFFQSLSLGLDYKHFGQIVSQGSVLSFSTPVTYVPAVASYNATFQREGGLTQFNAALTYGLRGIGSDPFAFDDKRFRARQNFMHLKADVSDTLTFKDGAQLFLKAQGQIADQPLVSSEQFSLGGMDTVRGYLESETLGDWGTSATVELRTPNLPEWLLTATSGDSKPDRSKLAGFDEWRLFAFGDVGQVRTLEPLPGQQAFFFLASYGVGTSFKLFNHLSGSAVFAMPLVTQTYSAANHPRVLFRISGEF